MSAAEAMRSNRLHNQIIPNVSQVERSSTHQGITVDGFSEEVVEGLKAKGHAIEWVPCEWTVDTGYSTRCMGLRELGWPLTSLVNRSTPCAMKFLPGPEWEAEGDPRKNDSGGSVLYP